MKNLLTYINKDKSFDSRIFETQIINSLGYWKPEDIILATNFPYDYRGIKSTIVPDYLWYDFNEKSSKPGVIVYLLENKIINELTWVHDCDAFQVSELNPPSVTKDLALTSYGFIPEINSGSMFFKPEALDIFRWIRDAVEKYQTFDEDAINILIKENFNNIKDRIQMLDQTFNIGIRSFRTNVRNAQKPIRVVHFPPNDFRWFHKMMPILPVKFIQLLNEKYTHLPKSYQDLRSQRRKAGKNPNR